MSLPLKFQSFGLLFTYIHHSLISLSVLFKHKSFLLIWACSCIAFQCFGWKIFTSCPNFRGHSWRCAYFCAKLAFIAGIFLKKYPWYMKIHFQYHVFAIWNLIPFRSWKIIETICHCISPRITESEDCVHAHSILRGTWKNKLTSKSSELESALIELFR